VLVAQRFTGLTDGPRPPGREPCPGQTGKTGPDPGSQRCMTVQQTTHPAPCASPGPPLDVIAWRVCRLREAGFSAPLAEALAHERVDLHALLQLVDAGCPPELAARILSPADDLRTSR
jgi:hypothetical protein